MQAQSVRCRTKVKTAHAHRRGYDLSGLRARQVVRRDFEVYDLVLAMDRAHLRFMERLRGPEGFEHVLDRVEAASRGLVDRVRVHLLRVSI